MANRKLAHAVRVTLVAAGAASAGLYGATSAAQEQLAEIVVTGSRIVRQDLVSNSPIFTSTAEQITANADITLDTFLNTLPQVNPAGTTTSNNPGNGGQSNVDLRGLGSNRNLVLLDGRRLQPSSSDLTVDLNTIPQAMIESIEVITGGAGAVYGADAVAGVVNLKLKSNFEGVDLRYSFSNSTEYWDAEEFNVSGVVGGNYADGRGNAIFGMEYAKREGMIKSQRSFAAIATSTTSFNPEGVLFANSGNAISQAAIDTLFATAGYGSNAPGSTNHTLLGFNNDGSLHSRGVFNSPLDVLNWRQPVDVSVNTNLFPDLYSYNFDAVNILTLPLERTSFMGKTDYAFDSGVEVFAMMGWTEYTSATALAPTPFPTVRTRAPGQNSAIEATSPFVSSSGCVTAGGAPTPCVISNVLVVPRTNPFVAASADLNALLDSRTGDDPRLVGAGADEPILIRSRSLGAGLRQSNYENTVVQFLVGASGPLFSDNWDWEVYASEGRTEIDQVQTGNLDTQRVYNLINAADGGASICAGGLNLIGRQVWSQECVDYLAVDGRVLTDFKLNVVQGFVSGKVMDLPAGPLSVVVGAENRWFNYDFQPGAVGGPISGFNAQNPVNGKNSFEDLFLEALFPIIDTVEMSVGYRYSTAEFENDGISAPSDSSDAYKVELSWQALDYMRVRGSYQKAVRAPNFSELFDGGGSAPQYFDPCSVTTEARNGPNAAQMRQLCIDTGVAAVDTFVQSPGGQLSITTAGNLDLTPEEADTITLGVVFQSPWSGALQGLVASLDYYSIDISDTILVPSPNVIVADCYNYYGQNPNYSATTDSCRALAAGRFGGDIFFMSDPNSPDGLYPGINAGKAKVEGLDLQLGYATDLPVGSLNLNLLVSYLLSAELQDSPTLPTLDYKGTVSYFGAGAGTSYPEIKANLTGVYTIGDFTVDGRLRWIDSMKNRASVQFPGETQPTGVGSVAYTDLAVSWTMGGFLGENSTLRIGMNNVFDKQPPQYAPNVQSGTEPSLYDVVGRRIFGSINFRF